MENQVNIENSKLVDDKVVNDKVWDDLLSSKDSEDVMTSMVEDALKFLDTIDLNQKKLSK
jgi:hypothetical protein